MENNLIRNEEAKKLAKDLRNKYELNKLAEMIKENKIPFSFKKNDYRVRKLNELEKEELDLFRRAKYSSLLQAKDEQKNPSFLFENEIIELYKKERNFDIKIEIDDKIKKIMIELKNKQMKLGEALEKKEPDSILKTYADEIEEMKNEIDSLTIQKSNLLQNSFEKTLENQIIKYTAYLSLEIKKEEEFIRAYNKIEDFLKSDDELIGNTIIYSMALHYGI